MKARLTDEQIIAMIEEQEAGEKTADVCWRHGAVRREAAEGFGRRERQAEEAVDLSRYRAAPSGCVSHLPIESDRAFPTRCRVRRRGL